MLWVTITIVYSVFSSSMRSSIAQGRDRVERASTARPSGCTSGCDRDRAGDAEALLLAAGEAGTGLVETVLDLVPQVGARSDFSTRSSASDFEMRRLLSFTPASTFSRIDIVGNGFGRWNTMPT